MSNLNQPSGQQQQVPLQVRYDDLNAKYANQVLLNASNEEIYLDFSPGVVTNGNQGAVLPIHTRIVMTPTGVLRLYQALGQALSNYQVIQNNPAPPAEAAQPVLGSGAGAGSGDADSGGTQS
jgi:hypothetical protein